jgi:hypothetical protein
MGIPGRIGELARVALRRVAPRVGLEVVQSSVYSPIPAVPARHDPAWAHEYPLDVDPDERMAWVESALAPHLRELPHGLEPARRHGWTTWNGWYEAGDGEALYAMLRHLRPRRVLELGSGFSTLISAAACVANARDGDATELVAVDPAPRTEVSHGVAGIARVELRDARELPPERFAELEAGDVLFIDTSHIVKLGSEVNWLVLEVLPRLAAGVHVHFHDVFLPHEYPYSILAQEGYFNEQYLLDAFLLGNSDWEVTLPLAALHRRHRERLGALIPSVLEDRPHPDWPDATPSAFWLRRRR